MVVDGELPRGRAAGPVVGEDAGWGVVVFAMPPHARAGEQGEGGEVEAAIQ